MIRRICGTDTFSGNSSIPSAASSIKKNMQRTWLSLTLPLLLLSCTSAQKAELNFRDLKTPGGFHVSEFAKVDSPRMLAFSAAGTLVVTDTPSGEVVALPDPKHTGKAERVVKVLEGLNEPHGIAFHEGKLYVAENDKLRYWDWDEGSLKATNPKLVAKLPAGGGHSTRSIVIHNGKLYVSAGSTCNVCVEKDPRRAAVMEFNLDGSGEK